MTNHFKKTDGFTLIEAMVALAITSLVLLALSLGVTYFNKIHQEVQVDRQMDWHLFVNQMEFYVENSELIEIDSEHLLVTELDPNTGASYNAEYRMVNRNFIKRVHGGTQQMLMDVKRVHFTSLESSIFITGEFYSGEVYQVRLKVESWYDE